MSKRILRNHFNDGVERMEKAVIRTLANTGFRMMPWQAVRDLIREVARGTKLPEPQPTPQPEPPEDPSPGAYYAEGKRNGWLDSYNGRRSTIALTYPQHLQPGYASGYSDGQLAHQHGEPLPDKET